jgi:hypothetical protein
MNEIFSIHSTRCCRAFPSLAHHDSSEQTRACFLLSGKARTRLNGRPRITVSDHGRTLLTPSHVVIFWNAASRVLHRGFGSERQTVSSPRSFGPAAHSRSVRVPAPGERLRARLWKLTRAALERALRRGRARVDLVTDPTFHEERAARYPSWSIELRRVLGNTNRLLATTTDCSMRSVKREVNGRDRCAFHEHIRQCRRSANIVRADTPTGGEGDTNLSTHQSGPRSLSVPEVQRLGTRSRAVVLARNLAIAERIAAGLAVGAHVSAGAYTCTARQAVKKFQVVDRRGLPRNGRPESRSEGRCSNSAVSSASTRSLRAVQFSL